VFRYPVNVRHPAPLDALRAEIGRRRAAGTQRIGLIGRPGSMNRRHRRDDPSSVVEAVRRLTVL
jgi:hypothetical protein